MPPRISTDALREEGARGALIAAASTLALIIVAIIAIGQSPRWPQVKRQFFSVDNMRDAAPKILDGFWLDIKMFVIAQIAILIFALLVAVVRSLRGPAFFPLRMLSVIYIDIFRGIPIILLMLMIGFGLPALQLPWLPTSPMVWGIVTLVLSYSAYTAEVYRSGIDSVPESQRSSARALGLTQWQALRHAILPQAVRNVIPALLNGLVSLQKDVALVSVLGIREAVRESQIYSSGTFNYSSYTFATILFLAISIPAARFADWYTARDRARRTKAGV